MKSLRFLLLIVSFTLIASFAAGCGGDDSGSTSSGGDTTDAETTEAAQRDDRGPSGTIRIGSLFATEGAGEPFGPQQFAGAQLAIDRLNDEDEVEGITFELIQADGDGEPARAVELANDLIDVDEVHAILGATFSNTSNHVHPLADELGVPMLAVSNTSTGIVGDCAYPCDLVFRNSLGEEAAIPANVESYLGRQDAPGTAVVIHPDDDPFGEASAKIARQAFADGGVANVSVLAGDDAVERAVKKKPGVVMVTASSGELAAKLVRRLRKAGYRGDILGGNAFNSRLTGELMGRAGRGIQVAAAWFAGNGSEENREFIAAYRKANGDAPDQFAAQAYAGVQLLAEAADEADLSFSDLAADRLALAEALAGVEAETPLGEISFTPDHDIIQPIWIVQLDGKGGFTLVEEIRP